MTKRNMPATKLPKALSAWDLILKGMEQALEEGAEVILNRDILDAMQRTRKEEQEVQIDNVSSNAEHYTSYQEQHEKDNDKVILPEKLDEAADRMQEVVERIRAVSKKAKAKRNKEVAPGGKELLKVHAMRKGEPVAAHQTSSKG
jgi:hemerythrin-like domain-containing protein